MEELCLSNMTLTICSVVLLSIGYWIGVWVMSHNAKEKQKRQAEIDSAVKAALDCEKKSGDQ